MDRVVSGIRPTGQLHLGNYFGAIKQFIELQEQYQCLFFVADLHSLTTAIEDRSDIEQLSISVLQYYLACGVDPSKCLFYRQSDIPEIPYLALLLSMVAPEGELRRTVTFKEKSEQMNSKQQMVNLGLLTYPVLMAADILICNANIVPVGQDQLQHLEITREIARRYNAHFGNRLVLTEPKALEMKAIKVPGLGIKEKMSKSGTHADKAVNLSDSPAQVKKKVMNAQTDLGPDTAGMTLADASESVQSLYQLLELSASADTYQYFLEKYTKGEQKFYGELKKALVEAINQVLAPIQARLNSPECSEERVKQLLHENTERVRSTAIKTLNSMLADMKIQDRNRPLM